uniref:Uncharacterized protein n=1 Tax=Zea mays TaxID=4577 RepID=B4FHK1_MAIZE|nr:unknown [Zea mays]
MSGLFRERIGERDNDRSSIQNNTLAK